MKNKLYFRLGLFVSIALILFVGVLFYLGLAEKLAPRIQMVTTFRESVQGLTVGASVKHQGVQVGSVDSMTILVKERLIRVDMSINPDVFIQPEFPLDSGEHLEAVRTMLKKAVEGGLQCRLEMAGITGMRYVDMIVPGEDGRRQEPLPEIDIEPGAIYIASAPGTFTNMIDSVGVALTKISQVDFPALAKNLNQNLNEVQAILSDPAIKKSLANIDNITTNLETTSKNLSENITGEEIRKLFDNANRTMDELNKLNKEVQQKLAAIDTGRISNETADTMQAIRLMTNELNKTRSDFEYTMQQVNSFLASTAEFVEYLKRDPNALLRGKSVEPVKQR